MKQFALKEVVPMQNKPPEGQMPLFEGVPEQPAKSTPAKTREPAPREKRTTTGKRQKVSVTSSPAESKRSAGKTKPKKSVPEQKRSLSGLVPEGDVRLTANIREDLHLRLKIAAATQRTTIGELIEQLVEKYLKVK
jgi:hypothetical protein